MTNPKSEYRKSETNLKDQIPITQNRKRALFGIFDHLDLFRILDFEFRIYSRGKELK
jgi:hypothetical protein